MEIIEKSCAELSCPLLDMSLGHESGGDFSLPDYQSAIQRLINVGVSVLPETKFLSGGVLEIGGSVVFNVLYSGEGGDIAFASFVTEFTADTALPCVLDNAGDVFWDCVVEGTSCRVTGPRSVNIKCRLKSRIMCDERLTQESTSLESIDGAGETDASSSMEKLTQSVESVLRCHGTATGTALGEFRCDLDYRPVMCDGALHPTSCEVLSDGVCVKGDIWSSCLVSKEDGTCKDIFFKIPFESTVHVRDIPMGAKARAWGKVASVSLSLSEADEGAVNVSFEYDLCVEAYAKSESTVCLDVYSTEFECESESTEADFLGCVCHGTKQLTITGEAEIKSSFEDTRLCCSLGSVTPCQVILSDGKLCIVSSAKLKGVLVGEGDAAIPECDVPIKLELTDIPCGNYSDLQSRATCQLLRVEGKLDGDKLRFTAEVSLCYEILEKQKTKYLTGVKLKNERLKDTVGYGVKVYYPQKEEKLWDICKKYHADRNRVMRHNSFKDDVVEKGRPVIIM